MILYKFAAESTKCEFFIGNLKTFKNFKRLKLKSKETL